MLSREQWARGAETILRSAGIESARLDTEILLAHALQLSRTKLHASFDEPLSKDLVPILDAAISLRATRVPLAYITGHKEFYGRLFRVTPDVLIPRPESEAFIELLKEEPNIGTVFDIGTGSGALAVTAARELGIIEVHGFDISHAALEVARINARAHDADVGFSHNDLMHGLARPDAEDPLVVMANLPYVSRDWDGSPELFYEPDLALYADDDGLDLILRLLEQSEAVMRPGDVLLLESDERQHARITKAAGTHQFEHSGTLGLVQRFVKS